MRMIFGALVLLFAATSQPTAGRQVLSIVGDGIAYNCQGDAGRALCGPLFVDVASFRGLDEVDASMTADSLPAWLGFSFADMPTAKAYRCRDGQHLTRCDIAHRGTHLRMDSLSVAADSLYIRVMTTSFEGSVRPDPRHGVHERIGYGFVRRDGEWHPVRRDIWFEGHGGGESGLVH
jgi:hypothetical protein